MNNQMELSFLSAAENEAFARMVISAFLVQNNPTMSMVSEVRTAVSEAVTNAVVHAYPSEEGKIVLRASIDEKNMLTIDVEDFGCGIADVRQAMQPFFTTQPERERTGIGFALMQSFMDGVKVYSSPGSGTTVRMMKMLGDANE
jgi:stage II sporulation protein AB (anti-sigma F factor)